MFDLKPAVPILILAAALAAGCGSQPSPQTCADRKAPPGMVQVSFRVNFFPVQKALWVEDAENNYIRSLHVSQWVSDYGEEFQVLTDWVNTSKTARDSKTTEQIDAFTRATLKADKEKVVYRWDLTDWKGKPVKDGVYRIILQCDGAEGVVISWSSEISVGDEAVTLEALPEPPVHPEGLEMYVENVIIKYSPR